MKQTRIMSLIEVMVRPIYHIDSAREYISDTVSIKGRYRWCKDG